MAEAVQTSVIAAPAESVWGRVVSEEGINDEMRPFLRMTMPAKLRGQTIATVPVGEPLGRSWILLFGVLPVDYDDLALAELEPGRRFLERSTMASMSLWQHERTVDPDGSGSRVTDHLTFELRRPLRWVPGSSRLAEAIVGRFFAHRHRRLAKHWATA
jgi:ligand-binding SRPBCC domain-containing protein